MNGSGTMSNKKADPFMRLLNEHRSQLTRQQFLTLKGLIECGDEDGAMRGLAKLLRRRLRRTT